MSKPVRILTRARHREVANQPSCACLSALALCGPSFPFPEDALRLPKMFPPLRRIGQDPFLHSCHATVPRCALVVTISVPLRMVRWSQKIGQVAKVYSAD